MIQSLPSSLALHLPRQSRVRDLAEKVAREGGRLVVVGGWVRDRLCGRSTTDLDLEIFGLPPESISRMLRPIGFTAPVGRKFPVWRDPREAIDVAYPRSGARIFKSELPGSLEKAFREASRHRDLTVNAIGWDPLVESPAQGLLDPWDGRADLEARLLRMVEASTFVVDSLRVLRVARLRESLDARVDPKLVSLCRIMELDDLPAERIASELRRILCESKRPSMAFDFLEQVGQLEVFEPVAALKGVPQDPQWHPEGDVYVHTLLVVDRAAEIAVLLSAEAREILVFAALCHDLGKAEATSIEDGRIRSLGHEAKSAELTRTWLDRARFPGRRVHSIETLVAHHLAPAQFVSQGAGPRAYRRLARKLSAGAVTMVDLERLARADFLGRSTVEACGGPFEAGQAFLKAAASADVRSSIRPDVVSASQLIARGVDPGPRLGRLLNRCRELQDDTGLEDADRLMDRVLGQV